MTAAAYEGWALLELMGHRQRVGIVREVELYGGKMLQIDIPVIAEGKPDEFVTEFYGCSSIYALRPITEQVGRDSAIRAGDPRPARPLDYRLSDQRAPGASADDQDFED